MARLIQLTFFALVLVFSIFAVDAAPVYHTARQIGDLQCNIARVKIVGSLAATNSKLAAVTSTNATVTDAVSTAQTALASAGAGIKTIAAALLTGQTAPADARTQVGNGLQDAQTALDGIADTTGVSDVQSSLSDAISAGEDVVSQCN